MNAIHRKLLCGTSLLALCGVAAVPAIAQDTTANETVVVTGVRASLADALNMKRSSDLVTETISSQSIGQLPDYTIAEELNRLPGVNTQRDRGNASQTSIRGLGPRFVFGLVNGREIASSEPDQNVRYEIFPSEVLGAVQVYKTQDATLVPGGIAATIDIRTLDPLDYKGPEIQLRAGPTYNDEAGELPDYGGLGYRGSAGYVTHLTDNLAVAIAASVQREKNGYPALSSWGENQYGSPEGGAPGDLTCTGAGCGTTPSLSQQTPTPWGGQTEIKELTQDRYGLAGAVTWRAAENFLVKADALWSNYQINEHQIQQWYNAGGTWGNWQNGDYSLYNTPGNSYTLDSQRHVVAASLNGASTGTTFEIDNYLAHYQETHTVIAGGLNFDWSIDTDWEAKLDLSHSEAWRNNRWLAFGAANFVPATTFNFAADNPSVTTPGADPANVNNQVVTLRQDAGPEFTRDHINAATLDFSHTMNDPLFKAFDFGFRYSDREKFHHNYDYLIPIQNGGSVALPSSMLTDFTLSDLKTPNLLFADFDKAEALVYGPIANTMPGAAGLTPTSGTCGPAVTASCPMPFDNTPNRWHVKETTTEGYAKLGFSANLGHNLLDGSIGMRVDSVDTTSTGFKTTDGGATFSPIVVTNHYLSALPSLNLNLHLTDDQLLRFGASVATSRPPLDALRTGYSLAIPVGTTPPTGSGGNPTLKPFMARQVDLDYEWYFHDESLFSVAAYYKKISTFIGIASSQQLLNGTTYTISSPANGKGGSVDGVEVSFQTRFYFLPDFLSDFGTYANYSFADSGIREFSPQYNPYSMGGLARSSGEWDLFYDKDNFEARAAVKYHGRFTEIPGWTASQLFGLAPETTLDLSASYQLDEHIGFRFQVGNVTNEVSRTSTDNDKNDLANPGYSIFGRHYLFDISYRD